MVIYVFVILLSIVFLLLPEVSLLFIEVGDGYTMVMYKTPELNEGVP